MLATILLLATVHVARGTLSPQSAYSQEAIDIDKGASPTPSFDCSAARSRVERLICNAPDLSRKDREVAQAYRLVQAAHPDQASDVRQAQLAWWKQREACVNSGVSIRTCVERVYNARLSELGGVGQSMNEEDSTAMT